jgi:hypothetical protein
LEEEGYVVREAGRAKMLWLTEKGWEAVGRIALMGTIAAGRGLEAVAVDEAYSLASELLVARSGRQRYLLRVVGQSMVGARIEDGDLLVVEEDESPTDGSVVVVLLREGEEVTVKRFYREGEKIRLRPEAPGGEYEEMVDAVDRRLDTELGLDVADLRCVLPDFAYTATDASGITDAGLNAMACVMVGVSATVVATSLRRAP